MTRKIVLAACKLYHPNYEGELILSGYRHWSDDMHNTYDILEKMGWKVLHTDEAQGFVDNTGKYYTRQEAIQFVKDSGQFYDPNRGNHAKTLEECDIAFSEGFW